MVGNTLVLSFVIIIVRPVTPGGTGNIPNALIIGAQVGLTF